MIFKKTHSANRGTSTYQSEDGKLTIYVPKSAGTHPETLELSGLTAPEGKAAKVKGVTLTKEERKAAQVAERARFAALTPEQKNEELRAKAATKREAAAKALKAAEERHAKLNPPAIAADAPATETVAV